MGNAAMRKARGDMLTNIESDQSESMDSLVRFTIFVYICLGTFFIHSFSEGDVSILLLSRH